MALRTVRLSPRHYVRFPWKNGAGLTTDIAARYREGEANGDWSAVLWRFGRTAIVAPGPFSDLAGFDRWQAVVAGRGLKLDTPGGEVDLGEAFVPKRYPGEAPIAKVEVSVDDGKTWRLAKLEGEPGMGRWVVFTLELERKEPGRVRAIARATARKGNVQPAHPDWNPSGYFWNGWHSVSWEVS